MKQIIVDETLTWSPEAEGNDETGKMAYHRDEEVSFDIEYIGTNSVKVSIGQNLQKHKMSNGEYVNPIYFIEFGFGVRGETKPAKNFETVNWEYNINKKVGAWTYTGWDGEQHVSDGTVGTNFMYNTIQKYRDNWEKYIHELLEEQVNGGI